MSSPLSVLIVDDHQMFREGIRKRLEAEPDICIVGEAASAEEAYAKVQETRPAIVILDIRLPNVSGIELARRLRQQWPELKILVLSGYDFDQYIRALARIGIDGYILKDSSQESLVGAIREIASGGVVLPPKIASKVMRHYSTLYASMGIGLLGELTIREIEVLELMQQGLRNTEIARRLSISPRTVEAHVGSIMSKLGAKSRTEAIRIGVEKNPQQTADDQTEQNINRCIQQQVPGCRQHVNDKVQFLFTLLSFILLHFSDQHLIDLSHAHHPTNNR